MTIPKALILATLGTIMTPAFAQVNLVPEVADSHPLVIAWKPCVNARGLEMELPLADPIPAISAPGKLYVLNDLGKIRDGYKHSLFISADGKQHYILQVGGIAGTIKVFGPIDPKLRCSVKPQSE